MSAAEPPPGPAPAVRHERLAPPAGSHPRRSRRRPLPGVLVALDRPPGTAGHWVVDAVDVSADGMGLVLPRDLLPGERVLLSFRLDENAAFAQVPAVVLHREGTTGGVQFLEWTAEERLRLLEHLVAAYEREEVAEGAEPAR